MGDILPTELVGFTNTNHGKSVPLKLKNWARQKSYRMTKANIFYMELAIANILQLTTTVHDDNELASEQLQDSTARGSVETGGKYALLLGRTAVNSNTICSVLY